MEPIVFKPSQMSEIKVYFMILALFVGLWVIKLKHPEWVPDQFQYLLLLPLFVGLHKWFSVYTVSYTLTEDVILLEQGIFNKTIDEVKLFRVVDTKLIFPAELRLFGLGHLIVLSRDQSDPELHIKGVKDPKMLQRILSQRVDLARKKQNIKGLEILDG